MVDAFKNWISAILFIGIIVAFLQLIIPNSKFNKYIYSLIGIVMVITVISPIINMYANKGIEESLNEVIATISGKIEDNSKVNNVSNENVQEELVKQEFVNTLKKDISAKLAQTGIDVEDVYVSLDGEYNITNIEIKIEKSSTDSDWLKSVNQTVEYINREYDIDYSKITVTERGR